MYHCYAFPFLPHHPQQFTYRYLGFLVLGESIRKKPKEKKTSKIKKIPKLLGHEQNSCPATKPTIATVIWRNSSRNSKLEVKKRKRSKVEFATEKITSIYFLFFIFIKLSWGAKDKSYNMQLHRISHWHIWNIYIWIEARVLGERGWSWQWRARWDDRS